MKATFLATAIVSSAFAFSLTAMAQDKPAAPAGQKEHTMSGCLAKGAAADTFVVNNTAEKGPKTIGIVSAKDNLAPHVGHKIDITGTAVPAAEAEAMKPAPPKADHYMRVSAVKMVSATCP
jgi:hypothetical protein